MNVYNSFNNYNNLQKAFCISFHNPDNRWQKDFLTAMIDKTVGRIKLLDKSERDKKELIHTTEQGQRILLIKIAEVFIYFIIPNTLLFLSPAFFVL